MRATRAQLERALAAEARKLGKTHGGFHAFDNLRRSGAPRANWTASYWCRGSRCPMDELEAALRRVQDRFPLVDL